MEPTLSESDPEARKWGMLCHLSALIGFFVSLGIFGNVIGPLVLWLLKKDEHPFVDDQGKEALNCQISMLLYLIGAFLVTCWIGGVGAVIIVIWNLVVIIIASMKSYEGQYYRYWGIIRFIT